MIIRTESVGNRRECAMCFVSGIAVICCCLGSTAVGQQEASSRPAEVAEYDAGRVGPLADGRVIVPTNQVLSPAGWQVTFAGRPTDLALSPDGRHLAALCHKQIVVIDIELRQAVQKVPYATLHGGGSFNGISYTPDGQRLCASCIRGTIELFDIGADGRLTAQEPIQLKGRHGGNALPAGLAVTPDGKCLYVTLNLNNTLGEIDLDKRELIREIPVGNAPYDVVLVARPGDERPSRAVVSNWGGRLPKDNDPLGPSGRGPPVKVDPVRHIASEGSVSIVDLEAHRVLAEIVVGRHASGLAVSGTGIVYVANANSDTVAVIDALEARLVETISTRPDKIPLFGSAPNALVERCGRLYVSNGTNNAVAVVQLSERAQGRADSSVAYEAVEPHSTLVGQIPTGWYPAGIVLDARRNVLCVANIKGIGSRATDWRGKRKIKGETVFGYNSHDYCGTRLVSFRFPDDADSRGADEARPDEQSHDGVDQRAVAAAGGAPRPHPVPERHGEPSVIQARRLHHQGEPHVRPGIRRSAARRGRSEPVHLRPRGHAQSPRAWPSSSCCWTTSIAAGRSARTGISGRMKRT